MPEAFLGEHFEGSSVDRKGRNEALVFPKGGAKDPLEQQNKTPGPATPYTSDTRRVGFSIPSNFLFLADTGWVSYNVTQS